MAFGLWNEPVLDDEAYPWKAVEGVEVEKEGEKEEEQDSQREEVLVEKGDREKDFFSEFDSERAAWLAGLLPHSLCSLGLAIDILDRVCCITLKTIQCFTGLLDPLAILENKDAKTSRFYLDLADRLNVLHHKDHKTRRWTV
ncbi:hypothetical protein ZTR_06388 [Talaromyces verruculosus]|nr:hypothetical protein ZTR_06388 [Talaromyces verruculosus]